ncbi:MAG: hypothetical protein ABIT05_16020 [Chitinophagaceae bacterium]
MRYMKWIGFAAAILLLVSCFIPWVVIESKDITITGVESAGTRFGKPGYFHFVLLVFFLVGNFVQRIWAKRLNLFVTALNLGWAIRNFFILSACQAGDCPVKKAGLYFILLSSAIMLVSALFPDMKIPAEKKELSR